MTRRKWVYMDIRSTGIVLLLLAIMPFHGYAQQYITGELSGIYPADDYVITGNVHVLPRTTLRFEPGSTLRFENFTGMVVRGELICNGTVLRPIRFTSSRDIPTSRIMPEAFDWNGIKVASEATGIHLSHCELCYSTFGLDISSNAVPVTLKEVTFFQNGSSSLIRQREMIQVDERVAISYQWPKHRTGNNQREQSAAEPGDRTSAASMDLMEHQSESGAARPEKTPSIDWRKPALYATGGLTIAGGFLAAATYGLAWKYNKDYRSETVSAHKIPLREKRDDCLLLSTIGLAIATFGIVGFTLTYIF